jgi:hypothetical protein
MQTRIEATKDWRLGGLGSAAGGCSRPVPHHHHLYNDDTNQRAEGFVRLLHPRSTDPVTYALGQYVQRMQFAQVPETFAIQKHLRKQRRWLR